MANSGTQTALLPSKTQRYTKLWFYLGVPFVIGFILGWTQVGRTADWPKHFALIYWFVTSFGSLFLLELFTHPFAKLLRPRGVPLWVTLVLAQAVIGQLAILPFMREFTTGLQSFLDPALAGPLQDGSLASLLQKLPTNIVLWVGVNLFFFYWLEMPRFGYQPPRRAAGSSAPQTNFDANTAAGNDSETAEASANFKPNVDMPLFQSRVRDDRQGELLALRAEGHYLRVYTTAGEDMVLYRLTDAAAELSDADGMRVHRSWWVADRAVASMVNSEGLKLVNGLEVPVSRSYRVQARARGWSR